MKDVRPDVLKRARAERWSFLDSVLNGVYTVPGDGCVDFVAAIQPLADAGYSGWLICEAEQDPAKAHPLTYARKGYATIKATAETVGLQARLNEPLTGGRLMPTQIQHFIGGKFVAGQERPHRTGVQPGDRRAAGRGAAGECGRGRRGGGPGQGGVAGLGDDHAVAPRAHPQPLPAPAGGEPGADRRGHRRRARQGLVRCAGRDRARHRGGRVRDRRAASAQGRHHRECRHPRRQPLAAPAAGGRRRHHAVQLPGHGADVDVPGRAGLRQLLHPQGLRARAVGVPDPGRAAQGGRRSRRRVPGRARRQGGGRRHPDPPRHRRGQLRRLDPDRQVHLRDRGQARASAARRWAAPRTT